MYCFECIENWLQNHSTCPINRQELYINDLEPASLAIRNLCEGLIYLYNSSLNIYMNLDLFKVLLNDALIIQMVATNQLDLIIMKHILQIVNMIQKD